MVLELSVEERVTRWIIYNENCYVCFFLYYFDISTKKLDFLKGISVKIIKNWSQNTNSPILNTQIWYLLLTQLHSTHYTEHTNTVTKTEIQHTHHNSCTSVNSVALCTMNLYFIVLLLYHGYTVTATN